MKNWIRMTALAIMGAFGVSCTTSYDQYGNRREAVDPAAAAVGAVAVGALGYSLGKNREKNKAYKYPNHYHNPNYGYQPYYGNRRR